MKISNAFHCVVLNWGIGQRVDIVLCPECCIRMTTIWSKSHPGVIITIFWYRIKLSIQGWYAVTVTVALILDLFLTNQLQLLKICKHCQESRPWRPWQFLIIIRNYYENIQLQKGRTQNIFKMRQLQRSVPCITQIQISRSKLERMKKIAHWADEFSTDALRGNAFNNLLI